jgi:hypothetical protein
LGAAKELADTVPFSMLSTEKTPKTLGRLYDLSLEWKSRGIASEDLKVEVMLKQADTFRGFENMMWALTSLEAWKNAFDQIE